jgi:elongation factor P
VFLYDAVDTYSFMENDTGEIHDLDISVIEWEVSYLKENLEVFLVKYDDAIIGIELSPVINYVVTETLPWDKWNRVSAGTKDATLENGMEVQVPMHTKQWDSVSLNTTTGKVS